MELYRILSIDYGAKRTGIAVTDPCRIIATPLSAVESSKVLHFLKTYAEIEMVRMIVVGMPKHLSGELCEFATDVKKFMKELTIAFPEKKITEYDERFTSKMATQTMLYAGYKKSDRQNKSNVDLISATILLQSFLDSIEKKNPTV